jgi:hypothetical protein
VVFLPTAFMSGIPGLVFKQFGWTIVAAVIASLLVARLVTPMMAAWLIRPDHREHREGALTARYLGLVEWCLRHRFATMAAGTAFFLRVARADSIAADRVHTARRPGHDLDQRRAATGRVADLDGPGPPSRRGTRSSTSRASTVCS